MDIGRSHKTNSPSYAILVDPPLARSENTNEATNVTSFDTIVVRKYFCDIDEIRCPRDAASFNYDENNYVDH